MRIAKKVPTSTGIKIEWADGTETEYTLAEMPDDIKARLTIHGLSQKIGDSYSSNEGLEDAKDKALQTYAALKSGDWSQRIGGSPLLIIALHNLTGTDTETIANTLNGLDDAKLKALKARADVKAELARMKAERLAKQTTGTETDLTELF